MTLQSFWCIDRYKIDIDLESNVASQKGEREGWFLEDGKDRVL